ncbi:MAG: AmmeMemoRadiSam system protein B [Nanoarchaeota archaeon]|nr:AmmeMemoRadiSam system protein B [Nanoarchaeota archaeon]MBU1031210.1 AmmeMemoRadiSam system protein B [Nanoarchaeota archaeon]MBU1850328.1 AmmeMemoRadiSam system protein B [Nanoarchaeota archaeon]
MRQSKFAGSFYSAAPTVLEEQIKECFLDENGPGDLPASSFKQPLKAVIVPHASFQFSGPCAAWSYKAVAEAEFPDLFILIGPSHAYPISGFTIEPFETPFGIVRVDQNFARILGEKGNLKQNSIIHQDEHCLEVQLPFLQFLFKKNLEKIKILPILLSQDADLQKIVLDIKETLVETGKKAMFIISSDFTHYGRRFHYVPFCTEIKKNIYKLDEEAINFIKKMDFLGFEKFIHKNIATICGATPISFILRFLGFAKVDLEQYYTSGDLTNDYKNSVSYASILFR